MPPKPSFHETYRKAAPRGSVVAAIAIAAAGVAGGLLVPNPLKSGRHRPESSQQITRALDSDWSRLASRMETVAHYTNNPGLIVERKRTDVTGGTGIGAVATVLTIKDGSVGQSGDSQYGFTAKLVEQSKDPQSSAVPPRSSFNIDFYGHVPSGLPFKKLIDMNGQNKPIDNTAAQPNPNGFSFSMNKGTDQNWSLGWSLALQPGHNFGLTPGSHNQSESIDPAVATSLVNQISQDIGYLLLASNTPPGFPLPPSFQS